MGNLFPPPGSSTPKPTNKAYKCLLCGVVAHNKQDLEDHCARAHPETPSTEERKEPKPTIQITDHYADMEYEDEPKEKKERKPRINKERDLLIEAKLILERYQAYKAFKNRPHWKQAQELIEKITQIL